MTPATAASPVPRPLASRSLAQQCLAVLAGTALLAVSSRIEVPMVPVPMTMQTFAVTLIGACYGARLGALTVLTWLAEALVGLPVLAGGAAGVVPFMGPTAGYLFAFPIAAAVVGWMVGRGLARKGWQACAVFVLGNALCLVLGGAWLAHLAGFEKAWTLGVAPFLLGGLLKSLLAASTLGLFRRASQRARRA